MNDIRHAISHFEYTLKKFRTPVFNELNAGLAEEEISATFAKHKIKLSEDLRELYKWRNGTKIPVGSFQTSILEILPFGVFLDLAEALKAQEIVEMFDVLENAEVYLPIFSFMSGDFYLYNSMSKEILTFAPIIQDYGTPAFKSLSDLLWCICECYEEGIFVFGNDNELEARYDDFYAKQVKYLLK